MSMHSSGKSFASDNYSGVHPEIMAALNAANEGHVPSYGADPYTARAVELFKSLFGESIEVYLVYNGTGANVLGLKAATQSFNSIVCSELAHINVDESTAPQAFTGCKIITVPQYHGKIQPADVEEKLIRFGDMHHAQPRIISISQSTEYGTVYTVEEIRELAELAHRNGMLLHMDGSRISNAAVSIDKDFRAFTFDAGVDILSFGGTKNGMMFGEAVLFRDKDIAGYAGYLRKQGMQLHSKMRFIGAQFCALIEGDLWKRSAAHANRMATRLHTALSAIPGITITQPVEANGVFAIFPSHIIPAMQEHYFFYVWYDKLSEVRLMCSFDTTEQEVDSFASKLAELLGVSANA